MQPRDRQVQEVQENSKANANAKMGRAKNGGSRYKQQSASDSDNHSLTLDHMKRQQRRPDELKVQRHGKYSSRFKSESDAGKQEASKKFKDSDFPHDAGDCRARGKI